MKVTEAESADFVKYASNPDTWVLAARRNLAVAKLLIKRARELQLMTDYDFFEFSGCFYAGYFHAALALENAVKAVRISRDPTIVSKDGLDRKFRTGHALLDPLKSVLGALSEEESSFVEKLEQFVWMGRYTVPTTPGPLYDRAKNNNARISSPKEPELLQSLFERTIGQLPNQSNAT